MVLLCPGCCTKSYQFTDIHCWSVLAQQSAEEWRNTARYNMVSVTLSGVIGPVLTEIHKSSSALAEVFFFFVSDLALVSGQQQLRHRLPWQQQQQWQHTRRAVRKTNRGRVRRTARQTVLYTPWLCFSITRRQSWLKKPWMLSTLPSMAVRPFKSLFGKCKDLIHPLEERESLSENVFWVQVIKNNLKWKNFHLSSFLV